MNTIDIIVLVAAFLFFLAGLAFFIITCYIIYKRTKRYWKYGYYNYGYPPATPQNPCPPYSGPADKGDSK